MTPPPNPACLRWLGHRTSRRLPQTLREPRWRAPFAWGAVTVLLALPLAGCWGYDPDHGELVLHNRSDQSLYVHFERYGGEESLLVGPVEPGEDELFFSLPRGRNCPGAGTFVLRDEAGRELARRDNTTEPVCDGEPWVWTGQTDERAVE